MQPKLTSGTRALLDYHRYEASLHQPVSLFVKNGRKLPNAAEPCDPWQCFLRHDNGEVGIVAHATGETPDQAVLAALYLRPGLKPSIQRLEREIGELVEVLRAGQN